MYENLLICFIQKDIVIIDKSEDTGVLSLCQLEHFYSNIWVTSSHFEKVTMKHFIIYIPVLKLAL